MIAATVGGGLTILGEIITKVPDFWFAIVQEKNETSEDPGGKKHARKIEELKNEVGTIYELSRNWNAYEAKVGDYATFFAKDYEVIGRYNKYPDIAAATRDKVHFCKVVASGERDGDRHSDLISNKKELIAKYQAFVGLVHSPKATVKLRRSVWLPHLFSSQPFRCNTPTTSTVRKTAPRTLPGQKGKRT